MSGRNGPTRTPCSLGNYCKILFKSLLEDRRLVSSCGKILCEGKDSEKYYRFHKELVEGLSN